MIVAAQFKTEAEAAAWMKCHPFSRRMQVVKRLSTPWDECPRSQVVQFDRSQPTPAYTFLPHSLGQSTSEATEGDDHWFEWAFWPVDCGGKTAWVWSKQTRINAVVTVEADGSAFFHQIMDVTCDQSTVISWKWQDGDAVGRGVDRDDTFGCAD